MEIIIEGAALFFSLGLFAYVVTRKDNEPKEPKKTLGEWYREHRSLKRIPEWKIDDVKKNR
jgi:hypothetical protein